MRGYTIMFTLTHFKCGNCLIHKLSPLSIFPSPDQELNPSVLPAAHNTGGSLPDLTNIQFPPPLSTPLDPEDSVAFPLLSSSNSTGSLTTNLTHLGISAASHGNVCLNFLGSPNGKVTLLPAIGLEFTQDEDFAFSTPPFFFFQGSPPPLRPP